MSILRNNTATGHRGHHLGSPKPGLARRMGGWALSEMLVSLGIGITFLMAMVIIFLTSNISFCAMGSYLSMDRSSRNALDRMSRNIRNSKALTSFSSTMLQFNYDTAATTNLVYRYASGNLTEEWTTGGTTTTNTLLTGCDSLTFSLFQRDLTPTTDVSSGAGKIISVAWKCSAQVFTTRRASEDMQQAQIVIRNQP